MLLAAALLCVPAVAQQPPAIRPADADGAPAPAAGTPVSRPKFATSPNPFSRAKFSAAEAQQVVQRAMAMDYQRTPYAFYQVMNAQRQRTGAISPADAFYAAVVLGDWKQAGLLLSRLPVEDGRKVYARLLTGLARQAKAQQDFFKRYEKAVPDLEPATAERLQSRGVSYSYTSGGEGLSGAFLSDDFFGVIEAAPCALAPDNLDALALLGRVALPGAAGRRAFTERLRGGLKGFRDSVPEECMNAARLLCALGWPELAESYLPATLREVREAPPSDLLLAADFHAARGAMERDGRTQQRAWELLCAAAAKNAPEELVVDRIMAQAAEIDAAFLRTALPALLTNAPGLAQPLLERLARHAAISPERGGDERVDALAKALRVQALLMEGLAAADGAIADRAEFFNGLVWNWLNAAEQARVSTEAEIARRSRDAMYGQRSVSRPARNALSAGEALAAAPAENVIATLGSGLARQARLLKFALLLLAFDETPAMAYLRICCAAHPADSADLCAHYLAAWVDGRSSAFAKDDPEYQRLRAQGYMGQQLRQPRPDGIPLTRARQAKNVADLRALLAALRGLSPALDPARVAWAFVNIHSGAEVYRLEDITAIFGPPEDMERAELRLLLSAMRVNLAGSWRDLDIQQKAGTNRSEQDVQDEVGRGYNVALELLRRGLGQEGGTWEDQLVRGQLCFDASEFARARGGPLAGYVGLRDASFASYRAAAQTYGSNVLARPRGAWTVVPYQAWFYVLLGASDLAALAPGQTSGDPGFVAIRDALRALPGEAAPVHVALFAAVLTNQMENVPPNMRQKFLAAGVRVVGEDDPLAAPARERLDYYANLTGEVRLRLAVDGPTRVGHGRPFGVFVTLEHTKQLAREGGGFAKYLQNQAAQTAALYGGQPPAGRRGAQDYRDNFETNFHSALGAQFDVQSLTFVDPSVTPLELPHEGWQALPLAYAVLRAKDPAVDRIPSVQLDMDFVDRDGAVVLPILSQVVSIHAAGAEPAARPCVGLAVTMTMDDREWRGHGRIALEVAAAGHGLIPAQQELFALADDGLEPEIRDGGLAVSAVRVDGGGLRPQVSRTWQISLLRKKGAPPAVAHFPRLASAFASAKTEYKRYVDADIATLDAAAAAAGIPLPGAGRAVQYGLWVALLTVAMLFFVFFMRRWGRPSAPRPAAIPLPREFTPFAVIAFLRRLAAEQAQKLNDADRAELERDINGIEAAHFGPGGSGTAPDLRAIAMRWSAKA